MTKKKTLSKRGTPGVKHSSLRWSGLQFRMTVSYILTTLIAVLVAEILIGGTVWLLLTYGTLANSGFLANAKQTAKLYALAAAAQSEGATLDPHMTFEPGQPASIALPKEYFANQWFIGYNNTHSSNVSNTGFALIIAPDTRALASSYPAYYPATTTVAHLPSIRLRLIMNALAGVTGGIVDSTPQGHIVYDAETIRGRNQQIIGAIYVQAPTVSGTTILQGFAFFWIMSGIFWLLIMLLVGGVFGAITTRGLLHRLHHLVAATTKFADGNYTQRVQVSQHDEVGQLEQQFNWMAGQLVKSMSQQQALGEQNARMAERSRIARDLHDSIKQQVFAVSMQLGAALALFDHKQEAARHHFQEAETLAYHVQQELTTMIQELRPLALQDKSLASALPEYVATWSRQCGIPAELNILGANVLPLMAEEALWRVAQEALSNIVRHSQATNVQISLVCEHDTVTLSISDNGHGFTLEAEEAKHGIGLHSMKERMETLGGTATIRSTIGEGTHIQAYCASVPMRPDAPAKSNEGLQEDEARKRR